MTPRVPGARPDAFVTYGWCRVSYVILDSLARRGVRVHAGDASRLAMCRASRRCASFTRTAHPYREPERYVEDVAAALIRTGARVLLPGHEDVLVLARHRDRLPAGTLLAAPDPDLLEAVRDKGRLAEIATRAGVAMPETWTPHDPAELHRIAAALPYPAVVKPRVGNSAKGITIVPDPAACVAAVERLVARHRLAPERWPLIQAFAPGDGYGVCLLYDQGQLQAVFCERYLRAKDGDFGTSVLRESVHAPALVEQARALLDPLGWHGVAHLDFLHDPVTGKSALLEVNPRFWGALDLAVRAGVDFPWLLYRMLTEGDIEAREPVASYRAGVTSRWIVGELLHGVNRLRRGQLGGAARWLGQVAGRRADGCDDLRWDDPLPLAAEMTYYGSRFLAAGSVNPVEEGMLG
jgi:predicted ATP-grasp superfamily ATP-dependent carboligase